MFCTSSRQIALADWKGGGVGASASRAWVLSIFLALVGCQANPVDRPADTNLPEPHKESPIPNLLGCAAFSPDGSRIAGTAFSDDGPVKVILDARTGNQIVKLPQLYGFPHSVAYSPDGKLLAWGLIGRSYPHCHRELLLLLDSDTGKVVRTFPSQTDGVYCVAFSPDGKLLASTNKENVRLWDVATGKEVRTLQGHTDDVLNVAFSPDSKQLASTGNDNTARVWDVQSGNLLNTFTSEDTMILLYVAFHPDGHRLAAAGPHGWRAASQRYNMQSGINDAIINVWNLKDPTKVATLRGHKESIVGLVFHPDGRHLFSLDYDGVLIVWDMTTRKRLYTLEHLKPINSTDPSVSRLALSRDGRRLVVSYTHDQPATVWSIQPRETEKR